MGIQQSYECTRWQIHELLNLTHWAWATYMCGSKHDNHWLRYWSGASSAPNRYQNRFDIFPVHQLEKLSVELKSRYVNFNIKQKWIWECFLEYRDPFVSIPMCERSSYISMPWCKTAVTPLSMHWYHCKLALSYRCNYATPIWNTVYLQNMLNVRINLFSYNTYSSRLFPGTQGKSGACLTKT